MDCVACGSAAVTERPEHTARGYRRFRCRDCGKQYNERSGGLLNHTHYPSDVIALVVLWRHRQVVGFWARRGRCWHGVQAAAATPLTSAHAPNARALAARYSPAVTWSRRRWKRLPIWSWAERNRCTWPADLKRFICRSRRRVGWCEFSARLFKPLCFRCWDRREIGGATAVGYFRARSLT